MYVYYFMIANVKTLGKNYLFFKFVISLNFFLLFTGDERLSQGQQLGCNFILYLANFAKQLPFEY